MGEPHSSNDNASEPGAETNLPGLSELRDAVANRLWPRLPGFAALGRDGLAGLSSAVTNVPDGLANGVLVGVNPVYGLYATMMGPCVGGLLSGTQLMLITTTAASSLSTRQALGGLQGNERAEALFILVMLAGAFQILFGFLGLGRLIRFVSYSVTTGFLSGVSVLLILNQLPVVTGYEPAGDNRISQTFDVLLNLGQINLVCLVLAALTLALAMFLPRTPLGNFGRLVAIAIPSFAVALFGLRDIEIVQDVGDIPQRIPLPVLPSLSSLNLDVITGALAVAVVILVQGAGVSQNVPNPDGSRRSTSRDFIAQGAANVASGLFRGLPVGGSLSATALNVIYGGQSRWAAVLAGLFMVVIVMAIPELVSHIAMPALGALLILAGFTGLKPRDIRAVWNAGGPSRLAAGGTFLAALLLSIQAAVAIGVLLSAVLYVSGASTDVSLVELVEVPDGRVEERELPERLPSGKVTVLDVYGHLFYAGAHTLERLLPRPQGSRKPAVVLRLRGFTTAGVTLQEVLAKYADKLAEVGGQLYLTGISQRVHDAMVRTGKLRLSGPVQVYDATSIRGQSTRQAVEDSRTWLVGASTEVEASDKQP
jgi:SulP family sulfate permease